MDRFLRYARQKQKEIIALTREFVECESPSDDPQAVAKFISLMTERTQDMAKVSVSRGTTYGPNARFTFTLPGEKKQGQILALGHCLAHGDARKDALSGNARTIVGTGCSRHEGGDGVLHFRDAHFTRF